MRKVNVPQIRVLSVAKPSPFHALARCRLSFRGNNPLPPVSEESALLAPSKRCPSSPTVRDQSSINVEGAANAS